jgi:lipoate-protein ligase A
MYSLVLRYAQRPQLHLIDEVHRLVLGKLAEALTKLDLDVSHQGISDLALAGRKISGNSLRCKRRALLYHGTLLYDFPLDRLAACLRTAPRQPEYRAGRGHREFVTNLPRQRDAIREVLRAAWPTEGNLADWPSAHTQQLVRERYSRDEWNLRL